MDLAITLLLSFLSVWVWNEIFLRFARRLGALSQGIPNQRRWDSRKKPIIGGIGLYGLALGLAAWRPEGLEISRAFLAGATISFMTGLADDAFVSVPYTKLLGQLSAAAISLLLGAPSLEIEGYPLLSIGLTLFWYVAVMNAFNMMDNMDGIAGTLAAVILFSSFWLIPQNKTLYVGLAVGILAFLARNWYPSHLYMGDNGSQFLGFTLAYWGTQVWEARNMTPAWLNLLSLVAIFSLFAGDTFWVILSRLSRGNSPLQGGTDHLTHRLAQRGWPIQRIAVVLGAIQMLLVLSPLFLMNDKQSVWGNIGLIFVLGTLIGLVHAPYMGISLRLFRVRQAV
ncbi:MAG: MraY family glycosyltransferase [Bacteroidia bacterium]|nr:undecaprenyl/decaprenyl-phosphate alpha-N-acetylglucosaminyl 1-phosphate transferase [Bacteroidia bacterium]MDW8134202.1 MraY family glycosyltransferase [Bacteroidia bacterium]